jgi:predicted acetyltransferase
MIIFANDNQKQDVINIWKTSFPDDSQEFLDLYFQKKYKKENTLLYLIDEKPVSCLQMLPYEMTFYNTICKTSYISGAATLPEYKNQGIMGKLLSQSFEEMRKRGDDFTTLIPQEPWLVDFYQKQGYTPCFEYNLIPIQIDSLSVNSNYEIIEMNIENVQNSFQYYSDYCKKQNLFILKTYEDFRIIWEELQLFGGTVFICKHEEKICGIAFCSPNEEKLIVKDLIADSKNIKEQLLQTISKQYPNKDIYVSKQADNNHTILTLGMARILHVEHVLKSYAAYYPHLDIILQVSDRHISENNGIFQITHGKCIQLETNNKYDLSIDIALLTQLIMGFQTKKLSSQYHVFPIQHSYMSLMLD